MTTKLAEDRKAKAELKETGKTKKSTKVVEASAEARQKAGVKRSKAFPSAEVKKPTIDTRPVRAQSPLRAASVLKLRQVLGLSQPEFAGLLSVSTRTVVAMESTTRMTEPQVRRIKELTRLANALSEVIKAESLGRWLKEPNSAFGDLKPVEVITRGEVDRIWSMIYFLRSGVPS